MISFTTKKATAPAASNTTHAVYNQVRPADLLAEIFLASPKQPIDQVRFYLCSRHRLFYLEWNRLDVFVRHFCLDPYLSLILIFNYEYILK
jgi:hypothetical protein